MAEDKPKAKTKAKKSQPNNKVSTRNTVRRAVSQQDMREKLQAQGHLQHVIVLLDEIGSEEKVIEPDMLNRKKIVIDTKLKLINKYLPDLKSVEMSGSTDNTVTFAKPSWLK